MKTLIECEKNGLKGWKSSEDGTCFTGFEAKQRAMREDSQKKAETWRREPKPSTVEFLRKHSENRKKREEAEKKAKEPKKSHKK